MSDKRHKLPALEDADLPDAGDFRIGVVVSEWHGDLCAKLSEGCIRLLRTAGVRDQNIIVHRVPGSFELPLASQWLIEKEKVDGVVCIGTIIKGETPHFKYVCHACAAGIKDVSLKTGKPVAFGVLTTANRAQAVARSGGELGNKGEEAGISVLRMISLNRAMSR